MVLINIFIEFFKTGLFAIGGGLATLPFLYKISDKFPEWYSKADLANMIAISESTPGPIGINMATFAGYQAQGLIGSLVATLSIILPSLIIVLIIARFLEKFNAHPLVRYTFYGLRPAVCGLIATAGAQVVSVSMLYVDKYTDLSHIADVFNVKALVLFAVVFVGIMKFKKIHPVVFLAAAAVIGIVFKF